MHMNDASKELTVVQLEMARFKVKRLQGDESTSVVQRL